MEQRGTPHGAERFIPEGRYAPHETFCPNRGSPRAVNDHDHHSLFAALNEAAEILHRNRTPDPAFVAAFDTLKQARAMLEHAIRPPATSSHPGAGDLAAA